MKKKNLALRHRLVCALPYVVLHWLIKEGLLHEYCNNTIEQCTKVYPGNAHFISFIETNQLNHNKEYYEQLINWAFYWDNTPEGYNFWYRRNNWFKDYLDSIFNF